MTDRGSTVRPFRLDLAGGHHLAGDELPGNGPYYLFLHGLGSVRAGQKSDALLRHAAARGRGCLRIDLRGHGESSGCLGEVPVSTLIADVGAVLERLGSAVVVGSSLGGLIGAYAAAAQPQRVAALALLAPALGMLRELTKKLDPAGRLWTSNGTNFVVAPHVLADAANFDERHLPGSLTMPTLVVHGTADDVIPPQASERFFAALGTTQRELWLVPGGDHRLAAFADAIWRRLDALLGD